MSRKRKKLPYHNSKKAKEEATARIKNIKAKCQCEVIERSCTPFPLWMPFLDDIEWIQGPEADACLPLPDQSVPFHVFEGGNKNEGRGEEKIPSLKPSRSFVALHQATAHTLPLFGTFPLFKKKMKDGTCMMSNKRSGEYILNAGGSVWDIAWCPSPPTSLGIVPHQYVAIAAHNKREEEHIRGRKYKGKHVIQIWDVGPLGSSDGNVNREVTKHEPYIALAIIHDKNCVWNMEWCPEAWAGVFASHFVSGSGNSNISPSHEPEEEGGCSTNKEIPRLGILACAMGDGSVDIFSIPHPTSLRNQLDIGESEGKGSVLVIRLTPIVSLQMSNAFMWRLAWCPASPHNILITGSIEGEVTTWKLESSELGVHVSKGVGVPIYSAIAHAGPVHRIRWSHRNPQYSFATAGMSGYLKFWDTRTPFVPILSHQSGTTYTTDLIWPEEYYPYTVFCFDDQIRHFNPNIMGSRIRRDHSQVVWRIDSSYWLELMASCDSGGEVLLLPLYESIVTTRKTRQTGRRLQSVQLYQISSSAKSPTLNIKVTKRIKNEEENTVESSKFPNSLVSQHVVKLNPNKIGRFWCISGGSAGLVLLLNYKKVSFI